MKSRLEIVNDAKRLRSECLQIVTDAEHWNKYVRKKNEAPTDADPNGELRRTIASIDRMLASEIRICEP